MEHKLNGRLIRPYQSEGVKWMVERELDDNVKGGIMCDEMGLGKTVQTLAMMLVNFKPRTLIIVPKSIVGQWVSEVKKFAPTLTVMGFDGPDRKITQYSFPNVIIAPYSIIPTRANGETCPLIYEKWDRVILDEGHEIRNPKSKTSVSVRRLDAEIKWILTGTPVFNSIRDFVTLAGFIGISRNEVQAYTDNIRNKFVLRRTKLDLALICKRLELPKCIFDNVELEMYPDEKELYEEVFRNGQGVVKSIVGNSMANFRQMEMLEALLRVRQVMTWPQMYLDGIAKKEDTDPVLWSFPSKKMETLMELIKSHPKEKSLIFCQFVGEMDEIQRRLTLEKISTLRIDGSVTGDARDERISLFRKGVSNTVFLIQIKAGGVGLNLQEATRIYITSPSWNPATELQAIGRAHRTGQTNVVHVKRLVYAIENSVEMSIMQLQESKAKICAQLLNDPRLETQIVNTPKTVMNVATLKKIFSVVK